MTAAGLASRVLGAVSVFLIFQYLRRRAFRRRTLKAKPSPQEVRTAIDAANSAYLAALRAGDAAAYAAVFAPDGLSLPADGKAVRGREAIESTMMSAFAKVKYRDGYLRTVDVLVSGGLAYEVGDYGVEYVRGRQARTAEGRYFSVWQLIGGEWKLAVEAGQPGAPPAAA